MIYSPRCWRGTTCSRSKPKATTHASPVFVLDAAAHDPDRLLSGRCSANHLVKVRTSGCRVFLALIPPDELTNVSIDTTFTWVGTRGTAQDVNALMSHPMLRQIAEAGLSTFFSGRQSRRGQERTHVCAPGSLGPRRTPQRPTEIPGKCSAASLTAKSKPRRRKNHSWQSLGFRNAIVTTLVPPST